MSDERCQHCGRPIRLHNAGTVSNPHEVWMDDRAELSYRTVCPAVNRGRSRPHAPEAEQI